MVRIRVRPVCDLDDLDPTRSPCSPSSSGIPVPALSVKVRPASSFTSPATHVADAPNRGSSYGTARSSLGTPPLVYSYFSPDSEGEDEAFQDSASSWSSCLSAASDSSLEPLFHEGGATARSSKMRDFAMLGDHRSRMHDPIPLIPVPSGSALLREVCLTCKICSKLVEHPMDSGCEDHKCAHRDCGDLPSGWYTPFCHAHECKKRGCPLPRVPLHLYCSSHNCSVPTCTISRETGKAPFCPSHACQLDGCRSKRVDWSYFCWEHRCRDLHCEKPVCEASCLFCKTHLAENHVNVETYGLSPDLRRLRVLHSSLDAGLHRKRSRLGHPTYAKV